MNKEIMKKAGFRKEVKRVEAGRCPLCGSKINIDRFRDRKSLEEFRISGMCQDCQDQVFTE